MKIELRKVAYSAKLSQETLAFAATVFIDGKEVGSADNDGHGGATRVFVQPPDLRKAAEEFCRDLPPRQFPAMFGMPAFEVPMDLEQYVECLLEAHLERRR